MQIYKKTIAMIKRIIYTVTKNNRRERWNMISALNVANTVLQRARNEKINITPMKLQKMVYFLYKAYLKKPASLCLLSVLKHGVMDP